jgi:hypothetical protein
VCGPGSFRAIEILFLDGGETGLSIDALSSCVSARISSPAISSQEAPTSSDDELRVPVASSATVCSRMTNMGHAQRRLIIEVEPDLVAAADSLPHQASRGGDFSLTRPAPRNYVSFPPRMRLVPIGCVVF